MTLEEIKKREKKELKLAFAQILCFASFILLPFGIIIEYDAVSVLVHVGEYRSGVLKGDSVFYRDIRRSHRSSVFFVGHVDSISTVVMVGTSPPSDEFTARALGPLIRQGYFEHPVWYRPDGKHTLNRFAREKNEAFIERVWLRALSYFTFMLLPFPLCLAWALRLKKEVKRMKALEPPQERWVK
jgi:hypothetical protein